MNKKIPNNLKKYRLKAGLKQTDVAQVLGLSSTDRISRWENGLKYPHVTNLFKLGKLYNINVQELYQIN